MIKTDHIDFWNTKLFTSFIVTPPGLELITENEVQKLFKIYKKLNKSVKNDPLINISVENGGISLNASLETIIYLTNHLQTCTRVLLRFHSFKFKDLPTLYKELKKISWKSWLPKSTKKIEFNISVKNCRINHRGRIENTLNDFFSQKIRTTPDSSLDVFKVYLKGIENNFLLSLDLTGNPNWKRGTKDISKEKELKAIAPLKEHIANAILQHIINTHSSNNSPIAIVDPCAGSGTFLIEGNILKKGMKKPNSKKSYEEIPLIKGNLFKLKKLLNPIIYHENIKEIIGSDLKKRESPLIIESDIFSPSEALLDTISSLIEPEKGRRNIIVLSNLPYGIRVSLERPIKDYIIAIRKLARATTEKSDWFFYFLISNSQYEKLKMDSELAQRIIKELSFKNGGIPVVLIQVKE